MNEQNDRSLRDTGERMIPTGEGEVSYVFARHKFAYEQAKRYAQGCRVLDVGCGTGYGCKILSEVASSVVGIDYSAEAVAYCNANSTAPNVLFEHANATDIAFNREFDLALSFQVIEHHSNPPLFLKKIKQAVRPGGTILLTTPNAREPVRKGEENPFHENEMNYEQFKKLLSEHFSSFELLGIGYASPNKLRTLIQRSPLYRLGKYFNRKNPIKKLANATMNLTNFQVLHTDIAHDAIDLFAICKNE